MFIGKVDELNHLLVTVYCNDIYNSQIDEIKAHYGEEEVNKAEKMLYDSGVLRLLGI